MRILISAFFLAASLLSQAPKVKPPPDEAAPGYQSINAEDCKGWLSKLASEDFEGREAGTAGYQKAADMVAAHFRDLGLKAVADKDANGIATYFQNVPFVASGLDADNAHFDLTGGKDPIHLKLGEGFGCKGSGTLTVNAPVTFVVLTTPVAGKLPEFDVKGKVVILVAVGSDGEPATVPREGKVMTGLTKTGPAAIVMIDDVAAAKGFEVSSPMRKDKAGPRPERGITPVISKAVALDLAKAAGKDIAATMTKVKSGGEAQSVATKLTAKVALASTVTDIPVPNVVGYLEGSDPVMKNELVIIGSHLDHLGRGRRGDGTLHPGADDDGSGSTGILAVSRAFTKNARHPKRSMLFLTFCGEEEGLWGSDWYVTHPIYPHASVMAELQMDMIGRHEEPMQENPRSKGADQTGNTLKLIGAKKIAPLLNDIIEGINKEHVGFDFEYDMESVYYRSDHYNFAKNGIPIAFFFTGFHKDYHQPTDTPDRIDYPKLARVAQLVYLTGWDLAERPQRLPVEKGKKPEKEK